MSEKVLDFIHRRFPQDCNWTTGNCFWFAVILNQRFGGKIMYDSIDGHFLFKYENQYYDYTGLVQPSNLLYDFDTYEEFDAKDYHRVVRDCIL